jgi:hypothetical protein
MDIKEAVSCSGITSSQPEGRGLEKATGFIAAP